MSNYKDLNLAISIFISTAIMSVNAINEEPPFERNGKGIPTTGSKPIVMPILKKKWKNKIPATAYP